MKFCFFLSFFAVINVFSQENTHLIHAVVGLEISKEEKIKYLLFSEISDSNFVSASFKKEDSFFIQTISLLNNIKVIDTLTTDLVEQIILQIDKLNEYYVFESSRDSILKIRMDSVYYMGGRSFQSVDDFYRVHNYNFKEYKKDKRNSKDDSRKKPWLQEKGQNIKDLEQKNIFIGNY